MLLISSSLSLLVIATGIFLYMKVLKDELNWVFKIAAYFIIIIGFLNLFSGCAYYTIKTFYKLGSNHSEVGCGHSAKKTKKHKHNCKYDSGYHMSNYECKKEFNKKKCMDMKQVNKCMESSKMNDNCQMMTGGKMSGMKEHMMKMMQKDSVLPKK